jgi:aminoglycoside 3-N-acetyltransferase
LVRGEEIVADLRSLGVTLGQTLLVHASVSRIGLVEGGPPAVVSALKEAVGDAGNVVTPTGTPENSNTSRAHLERIATLTPAEIEAYLQDRQGFSKDSTPSTMGAFGEALRTFAGAVRSDHPQISFAAIGPDARYLTDDHDLKCHLGERSPLEKLYHLSTASVLLLGVGYEACTAFHLAEYRYIESPPKKQYSCAVLVDGQGQWFDYEDVVLDDTDFVEIGKCLEDEASEESRRSEVSVRKGNVGNASCRLVPMMQAVDYAENWMKQNRTNP